MQCVVELMVLGSFGWWPNSRVSVMGGEQASKVLSTVKIDSLKKKNVEMSEKEIKEFEKPILEKYNLESSAYYSTARIWDDGIIDPLDTRKVLSLGIEMSLYGEEKPTINEFSGCKMVEILKNNKVVEVVLNRPES